jgi:hypothetical protein
VALSACSSGGDDGQDPGYEGPGGNDPGNGCTITLSGEVTGTLPCHATAGREDNGGSSVLGAIGVDLGGSVRTLSIAAELPDADPVVRDYAPSDFETAGAILMTTDNRAFFATTGSANDMGTLGTFKVTALDVIGGVEGGKAWKLGGSFTATLIDPVSKKTVTLTAKL